MNGNKITRKQYLVAAVCNVIGFMLLFGLCIENHMEKTAWFVVFPVGLLISMFLKSKKPGPHDGEGFQIR
jgi:uncharacterized membrane protein YhaH (DUF805 family)